MRVIIGALLLWMTLVSVLLGDSTHQERTKDGKLLKFFVGYYSETTLLSVLTRTKTAIFTCISTTTTMAPCNGRRRKRALIEDTDLQGENLDEIDSSSLDGSQQVDLPKIPIEVKNRKGKKMTVVTSVFSTLEVYTTVYNTGTTLTASAICNIVDGMTIGNSCFG